MRSNPHRTEASVVASREIVLELNAEITKSMVMSRDQKVGQEHGVKLGNIPTERVEEVKYLGTTLLDRNSIYEEIKKRWWSGNVYHHSGQNLLSATLLSKIIKLSITEL